MLEENFPENRYRNCLKRINIDRHKLSKEQTSKSQIGQRIDIEVTNWPKNKYREDKLSKEFVDCWPSTRAGAGQAMIGNQ